MMHLFATTTAEQALELGKTAAVIDVRKTATREEAEAADARGSKG
jgi:hypothetical protein